MKVFASGIRNAVGIIAVQPNTGELWCSVNERDGLGDNLVPDYITHEKMAASTDGRGGSPARIRIHVSRQASGIEDKVIVPDVLLQPHNASLEITFYDGKQFPAEYQGDIFAAQSMVPGTRRPGRAMN